MGRIFLFIDLRTYEVFGQIQWLIASTFVIFTFCLQCLLSTLRMPGVVASILQVLLVFFMSAAVLTQAADKRQVSVCKKSFITNLYRACGDSHTSTPEPEVRVRPTSYTVHCITQIYSLTRKLSYDMYMYARSRFLLLLKRVLIMWGYFRRQVTGDGCLAMIIPSSGEFSKLLARIYALLPFGTI